MTHRPHSSFIIYHSSLLLLLLSACAHKPANPHPMHDSQPLVLQAPTLQLPSSDNLQPPQQNAVFQLLVQTNGKPSDIKLTHSSGVPEIDDLCKDTLKHYKFRPAYSNGKPIAATTNITFTFQPTP